ncbi:MAG: Rne/Rng family ribonuclease [Neisseriaceae bacterium]|nr:Rne/Rng family ribonuclease [Neisseriaceae bacterium]
MKRMLFNATQAEELRVAIVDGQKLLDLDIETLGKEQRKGNIYKGTITRIEPALEACFVDYGTDRHGFLPFKEVARSYFQNYSGGKAHIQDVLEEGMTVLVQVEKDERGNKGAALTTFISLAGRYLVLMPNNPRAGGVSRRIVGEERQELKELVSQLEVPHGMSVIARTAGIGRTVEDLQWDLNYLLQLWQAVSDAAGQEEVQPLILQESALVIRAIRDYFQPDIGEILIDDEEVYQRVKQFMSFVMPANINRVKRYNEHTPLFSRFQIEHQIETAFSREVSLPSGGAIVIDHTEALVAIDVNSARSTKGGDVEETALKTNLEAAEEIARQLRLRDLGGLVVIDFIDMENRKNQSQVEQALREALKQDRARVQMSKLSRFGLMELSRQRLQMSLGESTHILCPRCQGKGSIRGVQSSGLHILRIIQEEAMKDNTGEIHAQVPVDIATFLLNEKRVDLFNLEERLGVPILLIPNIHLETPDYRVERIRLDDVEDNPLPSYRQVEKPDDEEDTTSREKVRSVKTTDAAVQGITHEPRPEQPVSGEPTISSVFERLGKWIKGLFAEDAAPTQPEKPKKEESKKNTRKAATRKKAAEEDLSGSLKENKEPAKRPDNKEENADSVKKPVRQAKTASEEKTPKPERKNRRQRVENETPNETAPQEQQPLVVNIGNGNGKNKKASKPAAKQGKKAPATRIRSSQNIVENIKHGAIVRNVQYTTRRLFPEMFPQNEQPKEPIEIRLPEMRHELDEAISNLSAVETLEAVETPERSSEERIDELKRKAKATLMRKKAEKAQPAATEPVDLGDLQLIETSSELKTDLPPEKVEPKGKRRSQVKQTQEESTAEVVLQQVETTNGEE